MSAPVKNKKKNKMLNQDSSEVPTKKKKKSKVPIEEEHFDSLTENDEVILDSYASEEVPLEQSSPSKRDKGIRNGVEEDNWNKEDYKELIRRLQQQIPKNDTKSFSNTIEKLDWSQIQFGSHSIDECYEKWKVLKTKVRHFRLLEEVLQDAMAWAESPWDSSLNTKKKNRHPDQPSRPLSSFMLYYMEKKERIMRKHPSLKLPEISKMIGDKFKALPEPKKAYYIQKAAILQEEYKQNLKEFYEKHPDLAPVSKKSTNTDKKPQTPFKLFLNEKLRKHEHDEGFNKIEFLERYKLIWKNLSLKKKAAWVRFAKEEEEKYWEQRENLNEDHKPNSHKSVLSKDELAILDRLAGKPDKPPNSAYSLFSKLMLQDKDHHFVKGEPKSRMKEVANQWKMLADENKRAYEEELKHMVEKYKLEFANYLESLPEDKKAEELAKVQPKRKNPQPKKVKKITTDETDLFKNEPAKPPTTAWDLFKNEYVKKNSNLPIEEAFKKAAEVWKNLPSKETEKYQKKHESLKAKYMHDFEKFLKLEDPVEIACRLIPHRIHRLPNKSLSETELTEYSSWKNSLENEESAEKSSDEDDDSSSSSDSDSSEQSDSGVSEDEC